MPSIAMSSRPKRPRSFRIEFPPELPISGRADEIIGLLQKHQVLVLAGETGSGKTTQIPKMCLAAGSGERGRIACTQPRRVAALSVSRRVAEELNVPWGREVGCKIRFADQTTPETIVKFLTDGMLLAELQGDPELREYDTIIVDEAHERSLNIDFILGHLRRLRLRRPELRIVITSATIDTEAFSQAFDGAPIVEVSGRVYPVEVIYSPLEEMGGANSPDVAKAMMGRPEEPSKTAARRDDSPSPRVRADNAEYTYIDAAVEAVGRVLRESAAGDVLVFLPTERDIRETCNLLEGSGRGKMELVPLFGRLTNAEQQRVFAPAQERKVVVATNIAETSLTIPGIRFVIDTGLARVSRYVPQSRTRRLPVEPVAQSSAEQRKGRCGRVSDGVCIRLYSEQDFLDRPRFAQPEIQRCNLADVILRMKAFGLGAIEEFPFLNAPPAKGIRSGYALLEELGALERAGTRPRDTFDGKDQTRPEAALHQSDHGALLTALGRELAHLPADPTVGRMILQARTEKALREVLVIAAALTIQDPRERPLDRQQQADAAHRRFTHPDSDFLTLLAIWEAYHDDFETMTLGKLRKFCAAHFLSFMRMREWRDVHAQLADVLEGREDFVMSSVYDGLLGPEKSRERSSSSRRSAPPAAEAVLRLGTPAYAAIHRSILSGLLGNLATRGPDGTWNATHDRKVAVFPGSALFEKSGPAKPAAAGRPVSAKPKAARWLMAAEIMETGRVYARTCARIDPRWALDLGRHLLRITHSEPFWSPESGRVLVKERCRLYNLELETRSASYGKINPAHATEIFIREGLVGDTVTWPFDFLAHNRRVREETETVLTRLRSSSYMDLDEAAYRFYARRLGPTGRASPPDEPKSAARPEDSPYLGNSSVPELVDFVRHRQTKTPRFLFMSADDLKPPADAAHDPVAFPDALPLENRALPLGYAYKPGEEDDGVTLRVSAAEAAALTPAVLDWAVPGHLPEKIELLLKALPKEQRRGLIPFAETAQKIAAQIGLLAARTPPPTLAGALGEILTARLGVRIDPRFFADKPLPDHLRVRVEATDGKGAVLGASRDLAELQAQLGARGREFSHQAARDEGGAWRAARTKWETEPAVEWKFGDLPESVVVSEKNGMPVRAHPGLQAVAAGVAVRLFAHPEEARAATRAGVARLFETQLRYELGWLEKDLRALRELGTLAVTLTTVEALQRDALASIVRWVGGREVWPLHAKVYAEKLDAAKRDLRGLVPRLVDWLREVFTLRLALQTHKQPPPGLEEDLAALLPPDFLRRTPFERVEQLPRYLKGMQLRAERWKRDPGKDGQRAAELAPFVQAVRQLGAGAGDVRWLVEEFRVSLFAQELGTSEPVSAVRLQRALREISPNDAPVEKPPAAPAATLPVRGKTVLKSLDALGNLPR
jgi:ATP-dependent helicase HrpA